MSEFNDFDYFTIDSLYGNDGFMKGEIKNKLDIPIDVEYKEVEDLGLVKEETNNG